MDDEQLQDELRKRLLAKENVEEGGAEQPVTRPRSRSRGGRGGAAGHEASAAAAAPQKRDAGRAPARRSDRDRTAKLETAEEERPGPAPAVPAQPKLETTEEERPGPAPAVPAQPAAKALPVACWPESRLRDELRGAHMAAAPQCWADKGGKTRQEVSNQARAAYIAALKGVDKGGAKGKDKVMGGEGKGKVDEAKGKANEAKGKVDEAKGEEQGRRIPILRGGRAVGAKGKVDEAKVEDGEGQGRRIPILRGGRAVGAGITMTKPD